MTVELSNTMDIVRKSLNCISSRRERSKIGQFFTPAMIARYMASLYEQAGPEVRILDPGAGVGVLFATLVETLVAKNHRPSIKVTAYENDKDVLPYLKNTMERCRVICRDAGILFRGEIRTEDFVASAIVQSDEGLFALRGERFTHAILNPPYKKINGETSMRKSLYAAGIEVSNLYAAFVWLTAQILEPGGEMVAITPRSFCNGPYFRRFRIRLLDMMSLRHIHVFESRKKAFGDDDVLQENVIYHAVKEAEKPEEILLSSSDSVDFYSAVTRSVPYNRIILPGDRDAFIHLVLSDKDNLATERMSRFTTTLDTLGIDVSTGPVVDFRAQKFLHKHPVKGAMPLIYPSHFKDGFIQWPMELQKKPNAIEASPQTHYLLIPADHYVLTKRFSSKEEKRRVVAAVYDPHLINASLVGFENHLNYFHAKGKGLAPNLAKGLALYLNSTLFDQYFRIFSGHTQVNATDLRKMCYPSHNQLMRLGAHVKHHMPDQEAVDAILEKECENNG
ncbi:MAG: Eco57I restriction-modification methylase domain-containing protein [Thermodesulfovibrionales bacterium]|nr:Eco57I restriction-modification methylase domain-containing protein [Thermodesulfovibrionales bacterium]